VKEHGIRAIETRGPFEIRGEKTIMRQLDQLLGDFASQGRMRLPGKIYNPCYTVVF
jgi:hypothetical protein